MNEKFIIKGGVKLSGEIRVNGAKNAALKILPAVVLCKGTTRITNFPFIEDTMRMLEMLEDLGAKIEIDREKKVVSIDSDSIGSAVLNDQLVRKLRVSILLAGPLLARFGRVETSHPGGCVIGKRPIDLFMEGFEKFGVKIVYSGDRFSLETLKGGLKGAHLFFPKISVTGTEEMMMTAVLAKGKTVLENCAMEPEIPALAAYLNSCGARISGAGTPTIEIEGVDQLTGGTFEVMSDRIEAGTFVMMGLLTQSELKVTGCNPKDLGAVLPILEKAGARLEVGADYIITKPSKLKATSIVTHEYPGFATDLQPPYTLLMTQAIGQCIVHEPIFEGRLFFTDQLAAMGANIIMCDPHRVVISGPTALRGKKLVSPDLRAGITMVLAGMIAEGETVIENIYQIDRGYENIEERLRSVGVKIERQ
jgi:UDP-N-acetylglucosamine 1-carboxyvinyltransferase